MDQIAKNLMATNVTYIGYPRKILSHTRSSDVKEDQGFQCPDTHGAVEFDGLKNHNFVWNNMIGYMAKKSIWVAHELDQWIW